jgi:hypothetical protein
MNSQAEGDEEILAFEIRDEALERYYQSSAWCSSCALSSRQ